MIDAAPATASDRLVKQTEIFKNPGSDITYRVGIAAPGNDDYSLADFFDEEAPVRHPRLAQRWGTLLASLGVQRAFAPNTAFTRVIGHPYNFRTCIELGNGIEMFRNPSVLNDAAVLEKPGDAMVFAGGGCSAIAIVCRDRMVAGHGGLKSLVDHQFVLGESHVNHGSIVDTMAHHVSERKGDRLRKETTCRAFASLPLKSYDFPDDHPEHGIFNRRLWLWLKQQYPQAEEHGVIVRGQCRYFIDQGRLIEAQARKLQIRTVSTCLEPLRHRIHPTTRHPDEHLRTKRNGIVIVRVT